jgi:hypothetical protein
MPIRVRHILIQGISGLKSELDFMRFLLLYSPVLEKVRVKPNFNVGSKLMSELLRFKRSSVLKLFTLGKSIRDVFYSTLVYYSLRPYM